MNSPICPKTMSRRAMLATVGTALVGGFLTLALAGCGSSTAHMEATLADGLAVAEGTTLTVTLPGNPTTGYEWTCTATEGQLEAADESYEADEQGDGATGVGGTYTFTFEATGEGTGTAEFSYARSWEETDDDVQAKVTVEVDKDGNISKLTAEEL